MRLRHATPARNLPSIMRRGLLSAKATGAKKAVWMCSPGLVWWAVLHTSRRHHCSTDAVAVIEIDVPRSWLKRAKGKGRWHSGGLDVPPARIVGVVTLAQLEM
ncbi:MAG TPA: hypothetical protein VGE74_22650 [Gemmata sp.]